MKLALAALITWIALASPDPHFFRYERPLVGTPSSAAQTCVALDPAIFAHAAPQIADLRLFHGTTETPYALHTEAPTLLSTGSLQPLNLGTRGGRTAFDAAMPAGRYSDVELNIPARDFIAAVTVRGSQSQTGSDSTRLGTFTIFDLTSQKLGRSTVLHLPASDFRYLHFNIAGPITPEDVMGLSVSRQPSTQTTFTTVASTSQITQKPRTSVVEFTVPANVPVDRIAFDPGAQPAAFNRGVTVTVTPAPVAHPTEDTFPPQPAVFSGSLLRLHRVENGEHIDEERLDIPMFGQALDTASRWTITVENGDDAPLALNSVRLEMQQRDLCFHSDGSSGYTLFYGDSALVPPHYDYATLFSLEKNPARASAGPEQLNPSFQSRPDDRPFSERHPALLWAALIAAIALLGGIAVRSASHTGAHSQPDLDHDKS